MKTAIRDELRQAAETCDGAASRCQRVVKRVATQPASLGLQRSLLKACHCWKTRFDLLVELDSSPELIEIALNNLLDSGLLERRGNLFRARSCP